MQKKKKTELAPLKAYQLPVSPYLFQKLKKEAAVRSSKEHLISTSVKRRWSNNQLRLKFKQDKT